MEARMGESGGYRNLVAWPKEEQYGLTNQVRRAVMSVPANIAEGQGRTGTQELLHSLSIANGSLHEVETFLLLSQRLHYLDDATCAMLLDKSAEVGRLIGGLKRSLQARIRQ